MLSVRKRTTIAMAEQDFEQNLDDLSRDREAMRSAYLEDETAVITRLIAEASLSADVRQRMSARAADMVQKVRDSDDDTLVEQFLSEYGLTTDEGVALMCLAEALLRVPDEMTIQALIDDKVGPGNWAGHLGHSESPLINITTWGLMVAGRLIRPIESLNLVDTLRGLTKRLGDPMVRTVASQAMKEMGRQFVLGRSISEALKRAQGYESRGYTYSYDMLGESAHTASDAERYFDGYVEAIAALEPDCTSDDIRDNPGISVKLSALHPRFEMAQRERVLAELVPRVRHLAKLAAAANMGFNIDLEEADRVELCLDVFEAVLREPELADWAGFGLVVQAYGKRAAPQIDWLYELVQRLDRKIMVRLVKGAYWDAEIKRAQTMGLEGFPVFTRKACSDVSYIVCAAKLLQMTDRIYPQFATHNAHSVCAILELAEPGMAYEFQRLHGMGESLYEVVKNDSDCRCRIYGPVGRHKDLLAYLVRRLLENGSNSSFVNQIVDESIAPEVIARDPFEVLLSLGDSIASQMIASPVELFGAERRNARGLDLSDPSALQQLERERERFGTHQWTAEPITATAPVPSKTLEVRNPADPTDIVGMLSQATSADVQQAVADAVTGYASWSKVDASERADRVRHFADLLEDNAAELFALLAREAGKTLPDCIAEVREAVDFARYYAAAAEEARDADPIGVVACISPWNFPLAIFAGQILANLAAGNAVLAKPAEQTPLIAARAVQLMHEAGIPIAAIQLLPGEGGDVGAALTADSRIAGVCFTGSTATAKRIDRSMAANLAPAAPLVAETGGLNAMIVDSTALHEQVVRDVLASAFQSAGQRCSALRILYVQKDIAEELLEMLFGAMDEMQLGNPWQITTDVGPVIDEAARQHIESHCDWHAREGRVLKRLSAPVDGNFVPPTVIRLDSIADLREEIFGPVLHVATFSAAEIGDVIDAINSRGYGLTFGMHSRVDARVEAVSKRIACGNMYVNRNQIGAIVGSQPFGGEGLSGTGPKAGGPHYVRRFVRSATPSIVPSETARRPSLGELQAAIDRAGQMGVPAPEGRLHLLRQCAEAVPEPLDGDPVEMPGPTGEANLLRCLPRGVVICAGPDLATARQQAVTALSQGNQVVMIAPQAGEAAPFDEALPVVQVDGLLPAEAIDQLNGFSAIASAADESLQRAYRRALAARDGAILPLIVQADEASRYVKERHLCIDTTAAGGNASLVANAE